jgi:hypothetical protein
VAGEGRGDTEEESAMSFLDLVLSPADAEELDVASIVKETLADVSPRSAALALLRFGDYLELIQKAGVDTTDDLSTALFDELRAICTRDRSSV